MIVRKSAVIVVLVVAVLVGVFVYLARNGIVERIAETTLDRMVGAPVDVQDLTLNPFTLTAGFGKLRIADSEHVDHWLVEAGPAKFQVSIAQLFASKFVISAMTLENVTLGAKRPGIAPPAAPAPAAPAPGSAPAGGVPAPPAAQPPAGGIAVASSKLDVSGLLENVDVSKLMQGRKLTAVQAIGDTQKIAEQKYAAWDKRIGTTTLPQDLAAIDKDAKALKFDVKNQDDLKKLQASLQGLQKRTDAAQKELSGLNDGYKKDKAELGTQWDKASALSEEDIKAIKASAKLSNLSVSNVGRALFGDAAVAQFNTLLHYAALAKKALKSDKGKEEKKPKRRAGRWVTYPVTARVYPVFAVEKIEFSGFNLNKEGKPDTKFTGTMTALTSDAELYGQPLRVGVKGVSPDGKDWTVQAEFDQRKEPGVTTILMTGGGITIGAIDMGKSDDGLYPQRMLTPSTELDTHLKLTGDNLNGLLKITAQKVTFEYPPIPPGNQRRDELAKSLRAVFADFRSVEVKATLGGTIASPQFSASSNMDKIVSERMNALLGKRMAEVDAQIRGEVNKQVQAARTQAEGSVKAEQAKVEKSLGGLNQQRDQAQKDVDKSKRDAEDSGKKSAQKGLEDQFKGLKLR